MCSFCMFWFHCRSISKGNGHVSVQPLFREKGKAPSAAPKGSETGLKPLWNTFRLTISDSMLLRLQHHCFILLFNCRKDVLILYVLVSLPGHFEGQWSSLSSASCPETGQSPVSAPKTLCLFGYSVIALELREKCVDCVTWFPYWTTSKHLPTHHLRLLAELIPGQFLSIFVKPCS